MLHQVLEPYCSSNYLRLFKAPRLWKVVKSLQWSGKSFVTMLVITWQTSSRREQFVPSFFFTNLYPKARGSLFKSPRSSYHFNFLFRLMASFSSFLHQVLKPYCSSIYMWLSKAPRLWKEVNSLQWSGKSFVTMLVFTNLYLKARALLFKSPGSSYHFNFLYAILQILPCHPKACSFNKSSTISFRSSKYSSFPQTFST